METLLLSAESETATESLDRAAKIVREGGIVAFPTETVYGLGAAPGRPEVLRRLAELKGRPADMPFTLHLADASQAEALVDEIPAAARRLMERYWPGPLTLVLETGDGSTDARSSVGLRVPSHELCREFLRRVGQPVAGTSANRHGEEPAIDVAQVREAFEGRIDAILEGGPTVLQQASTIVRFEGERYELLREGIITLEMIHRLLSGKNILFVCTGNSCRSPMAEALFKKHLASRLGIPVQELEENGYVIHSAGVFAGWGNQASQHAVTVMREMGCELGSHRSRPLDARLVADADRIYTLGSSHLQLVREAFPDAGDKVSMLSGESITDPIGGDIETYRHCAREIDISLRRLLESF